ncbi:MAG: DUF4886 domain-containing protein [Clostridia bacterium]|nr:DUF4886 domain-containing protein [Clostridia bacterium]
MKSLKVLFVGNSFAVDTMEYAAEVALALGFEKVKFCTLYVGGCSIDMHYEHAMQDAPAYTLFTNCGSGWSSTEGCRISEAAKSEDWDWIAIQHGTHGGSRYTSPRCYEKLDPLVRYIKELAPKAKLAFNLTWLGEPDYPHHEIEFFGGDMAAMRRELVKVMEKVVLQNSLIDLLIPTGTAIENARTSEIGLLTRDGYHLSLDKGRYIAALTMVGAITGKNPKGISWAPEGVDAYAKSVAVEAAAAAIKKPLEITKSIL